MHATPFFFCYISVECKLLKFRDDLKKKKIFMKKQKTKEKHSVGNEMQWMGSMCV